MSSLRARKEHAIALFQIFYSSVATDAMDLESLHALLEDSRRRNAELGVTGVLIYFDPTREFFQVLEGEEAVLAGLMRSICADLRHRRVVIEFEGPIPRRSFSNWSMGFLQVEEEDAEDWPGYAKVMQEGARAMHLTGDPTLALRLFDQVIKSLSNPVAAS